MTHSRTLSRTFVGLVLALTVSGCLEIKTSTRVGSDGSVRRIQRASEGTVDKTRGVFPSDIDSNWTIVKGDSAGFEASRPFASTEEFNRVLDDTTNSLSICLHASLEKHYKGFFVELTYRETYKRYAPFGGPAIDAFVSPEDLRAIRECRMDHNELLPKSASDSAAAKALDQRFQSWMADHNRAAFEAYCTELTIGARNLHDATLNPEDIRSHAQVVYEKCEDMSFSSGNIWKVDSLFQVVLRNKKVKAAIEANASGFALLKEKMDKVDGFAYSWETTGIEMPGIIIGSNARTIEGNKAMWKGIGEAIWFSGADLWVTSRIVNWWAIGGAGFLVLLAIVLPILFWVRKRTTF